MSNSAHQIDRRFSWTHDHAKILHQVEQELDGLAARRLSPYHIIRLYETICRRRAGGDHDENQRPP